jgi:homogentisate 1,2-dioxygenase
MPHYRKLGEMPRKKHTTFYKSDGTLYKEELVSSKGFSGIYSNKYHINSPTKAKSIRELDPQENVFWGEAPMKHVHFFTEDIRREGDHLTARMAVLDNPDCTVYTAKPTRDADFFYKNSYAHEYVFIHRGQGWLKSDYGNIRLRDMDQIIIPQNTVYQLEFDDYDDVKLLIVESSTPYEIPRHYRNEYGQLEEHAPYEERDFRGPEELEPKNERGEFRVVHKAALRYFEYVMPHNPFDVVGWDGYLYPYVLNMRDYNPKVGRIHLPPPIHLAFNTKSFVICNFNPRPFDWHPEAVPAPYYHTNVDSAEVLYYVEGDFMSRKGVKEGSITLHPLGIPHGPQPGKTEASIGAKFTDEYAVMIDTFAQLKPTKWAQKCEDVDYWKSWLEPGD